jgi:hypothetical protein
LANQPVLEYDPGSVGYSFTKRYTHEWSRDVTISCEEGNENPTAVNGYMLCPLVLEIRVSEKQEVSGVVECAAVERS